MNIIYSKKMILVNIKVEKIKSLIYYMMFLIIRSIIMFLKN